MVGQVLDVKGAETGVEVSLLDSVFGITPNDHVVYLDVKQFLANQRQGTSSATERADIVGSTRKLKKQKGTGTARAGSIKSPLFRGGGRVFGPRPRSYAFKLNKKLKVLARKSALSQKFASGDILFVEDFTLVNPKTKDFVKVQSSLGVSDVKSLFVVADNNDKNVYLASRNISNVEVIAAADLCTYKLLNAGKIVISQKAVEIIHNNLSN